MLKFVCPLIVVEDIARSRQFYEQLLDQKVKYDFGVDVAFESGLTIHLKSHFQSLLGDATRYPITKQAHNSELYFEADDIEAVYQQLQAAGVEFIEAIQEQPWGQRAMRLYDPDGHILEIGEPIEATVQRFHRAGWSVDRIAEKTGLPKESIAATVVQKSTAQPKAKVIKTAMQGKDYVRLLGGPPETFSLRSGAVVLQPGRSVGKHSTGINEELIVVLEGEGALLLNEGQELPLAVGTVAYCPPDTEHDVKNTGAAVLRYIYAVAKAQ